MKTSPVYHPSKLLIGDTELVRQHALTRWMSRDLMQAAGDFCRNLGLLPCYCETSPDHFDTAKAFLLAHGITPAERSDT